MFLKPRNTDAERGAEIMHYHAIFAHQEGVSVGDLEIVGLRKSVAEGGGAARIVESLRVRGHSRRSSCAPFTFEMRIAASIAPLAKVALSFGLSVPSSQAYKKAS